jgi:hypothetical protein
MHQGYRLLFTPLSAPDWGKIRFSLCLEASKLPCPLATRDRGSRLPDTRYDSSASLHSVLCSTPCITHVTTRGALYDCDNPSPYAKSGNLDTLPSQHACKASRDVARRHQRVRAGPWEPEKTLKKGAKNGCSSWETMAPAWRHIRSPCKS